MKMLVYMITGAVLVCATIWLTSCSTKLPIESPKQTLDVVKNNVKASADSLDKTTVEIRTAATDGQKATPAAARPTLDPYWLRILTAAGVQQQIVQQLRQQDAEIVKATATAERLKAAFDAEKSARTKAETDRDSALTKYLYGLIALCVVGVGISAVLFISGNKLGLTVGAGCVASIVVALLVAKSLTLLPWVLGGVIIVAIGLVIWEVLDKKRTIVADLLKLGDQAKQIDEHERDLRIYDKANDELVETVEAAKVVMTPDARADIFGVADLPGRARILQSSETEKLVAEKRSKLQKAPSLIVPEKQVTVKKSAKKKAVKKTTVKQSEIGQEIST